MRIDLVVHKAEDGTPVCSVRVPGARDDVVHATRVVKLSDDCTDKNHFRGFRELLKGGNDFATFVDSVADQAFKLGMETKRRNHHNKK